MSRSFPAGSAKTAIGWGRRSREAISSRSSRWTKPNDRVVQIGTRAEREDYRQRSEKIDRQIISATDLGPFGTKHFAIPFDAKGKSWVRFAVWDSAGNGAMVQPIKLQ